MRVSIKVRGWRMPCLLGRSTKRQEELLDEWARLSEMLEEMEAQS